MKNLIVALICIVVIAAAGKVIYDKLSEDKSDSESFQQAIRRLRADAPSELLEACTNSIVGLRYVVRTSLDTYGDDTGKWRASVTAEYFNKVGGVEREDFYFIFRTHPGLNRREISCIRDAIKEGEISAAKFRRELDAIGRR